MDQTSTTTEELPDIPMSEFEGLCKKAWEQKAKADALQEQADAESAELTLMKNKILSYMEKYDKTNHKVSGFGQFIVKEMFSVSMPKDPEKKEALFTYLKDKGQFEDLITINSATLNSYWKQELEEAKQEQRGDFAIPGLDDFKSYKQLTMRKG